jgi:hypothetical protein
MIGDVLRKGALLFLGFVATFTSIWLAVAYFIVQVPGPGTLAWNPEAPPPIVIGPAVVAVLALGGWWVAREWIPMRGGVMGLLALALAERR